MNVEKVKYNNMNFKINWDGTNKIYFGCQRANGFFYIYYFSIIFCFIYFSLGIKELMVSFYGHLLSTCVGKVLNNSPVS